MLRLLARMGEPKLVEVVLDRLIADRVHDTGDNTAIGPGQHGGAWQVSRRCHQPVHGVSGTGVGGGLPSAHA